MRYYYCSDGSAVCGPVTKEELARLGGLGQLTETTQVCPEGDQQWQSFSSLFQYQNSIEVVTPVGDIEFDCAACGNHLVIDDRGEGLRVRCPFCNIELTIPAPTAANVLKHSDNPIEASTSRPRSPEMSPTPAELPEERRMSAYAAFNEVWRKERERWQNEVFDSVRVRPGEDPFLAASTELLNRRARGEDTDLRNSLLATIANAYGMTIDQLLSVLKEGGGSDWPLEQSINLARDRRTEIEERHLSRNPCLLSTLLVGVIYFVIAPIVSLVTRGGGDYLFLWLWPVILFPAYGWALMTRGDARGTTGDGVRESRLSRATRRVQLAFFVFAAANLGIGLIALLLSREGVSLFMGYGVVTALFVLVGLLAATKLGGIIASILGLLLSACGIIGGIAPLFTAKDPNPGIFFATGALSLFMGFNSIDLLLKRNHEGRTLKPQKSTHRLAWSLFGLLAVTGVSIAVWRVWGTSDRTRESAKPQLAMGDAKASQASITIVAPASDTFEEWIKYRSTCRERSKKIEALGRLLTFYRLGGETGKTREVLTVSKEKSWVIVPGKTILPERGSTFEKSVEVEQPDEGTHLRASIKAWVVSRGKHVSLLKDSEGRWYVICQSEELIPPSARSDRSASQTIEASYGSFLASSPGSLSRSPLGLVSGVGVVNDEFSTDTRDLVKTLIPIVTDDEIFASPSNDQGDAIISYWRLLRFLRFIDRLNDPDLTMKPTVELCETLAELPLLEARESLLKVPDDSPSDVLAAKKAALQQWSISMVEAGEVTVPPKAGDRTIEADSTVTRTKDVLEGIASSLNEVDANGMTPLLIAAREGKDNLVGVLIEKGADVNWRYSNGGTALYLAAFNGHEKVIELLLSKGADPNISTRDGVTPLIAAAKEGRRNIVEMLAPVTGGGEPAEVVLKSISAASGKQSSMPKPHPFLSPPSPPIAQDKKLTTQHPAQEQSATRMRPQLPARAVLRQPVEFPAILNGKVVGKVIAPPGAVVTVLEFDGSNVTVEYMKAQKKVSVKFTDYAP